MNKYFMVRPSDFWRYDDVDIEGNYPVVNITDFNICENEELNSKFNYLFFEVPCRRNGTVYESEITEIISKYRFTLEINKNPDTEKNEANIYSDELGLYLKKPIALENIEVVGSKVSGLLDHMLVNEELLKNYSLHLDALIESSKFYKERYDDTIDGPGYNLKKYVRKGFFRNIK